MPEPVVFATHYRVSCVPENHPDAHLFTLVLEYRGNGRWAVTHNGASFDIEGRKSWGYRWPQDGLEREPVTEADRADHERVREAWLAAHRFDLDTATALARRIAPTMTYRGYSVADALAQVPDA